VFFDEAMFLPEVSMGAILPVISAQPDPQVWYMGSAVDQQIMDDGMAFARVRQRALKENDDRLLYLEWSLDAETPDQVEDETAGDEASWAATNPAFDTASVMVDPVCLAFDVSPDRSTAAIAAAGRRPDGLAHIEVVEHKSGTNWVAARIVDLIEKHQPVAVICDAAGPASSLLRRFEELEVEVQAVSAREHAQACGLLYDLVRDAGLRHLGTQELGAAVRGAATRPLGESWAWSRTSSAIDITPLVACTLALYGIHGALEQELPVMVAFG
jgi:hypothetical protein